MEGLIALVIQLGTLLGLIFLGYLVGALLEGRHYRTIRRREAQFLEQPVMNYLKKPESTSEVALSRLVHGSAVISIDYFKRFLSSLIMLFGGRVAPYESLLDRARREALLRMQAQAGDMDVIINVRIETSSISKGRRKSVFCVEAFAYGTALRFA